MSKKLSREEWIELLNDANALDSYLKDRAETKNEKGSSSLSPNELKDWFESIDLIDESDLDPDRESKRWDHLDNE
jgi:hypothetical protein